MAKRLILGAMCSIVLAIGLVAFSGCGGSGGKSVDGEKPVKEARTGEAIYRKYCLNCHQGGVANSPKLGDVEAWSERLEARDRDELITNVREGMPPGMPKMGLCSNCTEIELANAVDYMLAALEPGEIGDSTEAE